MLEATVWFCIKFVLMIAGGWFIGTRIAAWQNKRNLKEYKLSNLALSDTMSITDDVTITVPLGDSRLYLVHNTRIGKVFITHDKTNAAYHKSIGWSVFAMCFTRTRKTCHVLFKDTSDVNNPFNFLTGKFELPPTKKDSYVHVLE